MTVGTRQVGEERDPEYREGDPRKKRSLTFEDSSTVG